MNYNNYHIINCKTVAEERLKKTALRAKHITEARNGKAPTLAVIVVGDDEASQRYVRNKENDCLKVGIDAHTIALPATVSQAALEDCIRQLNANDEVDAIILQMPLPKHLKANEDAIISLIDPAKDADGLTPMNTGFNTLGMPRILPCTVHGVVSLITRMQNDRIIPHHPTVCIFGRSKIVGRPLAVHLMNMHCTVIECNSKTENAKALSQTADVIILATDKPEQFDDSFLKDTSDPVVVIDVGINRSAKTGKLCGNANLEGKHSNVYITPVPGGIGLLTRAYLCANTVHLAELAMAQAKKPQKPIKKRRFIIDTPDGRLRVCAKTNIDDPSNFPGVYVEHLNQNDDADHQGDLLACVEYDSANKNLQSTVFRPDCDTPVYIETYLDDDMEDIDE